jgi:hypothetical protein
MPTTPSSQPLMTWPSPRVKESACPRFHDASNSFLFVQEYPSYWTFTVSPAVAVAPVPTTRSQASSCDGGLPEGTLTVGRVPKVPAGERSAEGIGAIPVTAAPVGPFADVVGAEGPDVVPDAAAVVELGEPGDFEEQAEVASSRAAPAARRMRRLLEDRCLGMAGRLVPSVLHDESLTRGWNSRTATDRLSRTGACIWSNLAWSRHFAQGRQTDG